MNTEISQTVRPSDCQTVRPSDRPITCLILTYNESDRIGRALQHAEQWADEILVVDKSSTDATVRIARSFAKVRVETIPFSKQGHEKITDYVGLASHDWIFGLTPGEVPTRKLIEEVRRLVDADAHDLLCVPIQFYSFGISPEKSCWMNCWQGRVYHRNRVKLQNVVHNNIVCDPYRLTRIERADDCFLLHQTHATVAQFVQSHADYMAAEAMHDPHKKLAEAMHNLRAYDDTFAGDKSLFPHYHAWRMYWHGVALHCWERIIAADIPADYIRRAERLLAKEWPR